jgi:hypothetical protein
MSLLDRNSPYGGQISPLADLGGRPSAFFNIDELLKAVKRVNDLADTARKLGWHVTLDAADYVTVDVTKTQRGNGSEASQ